MDTNAGDTKVSDKVAQQLEEGRKAHLSRQAAAPKAARKTTTTKGEGKEKA